MIQVGLQHDDADIHLNELAPGDHIASSVDRQVVPPNTTFSLLTRNDGTTISRSV